MELHARSGELPRRGLYLGQDLWGWQPHTNGASHVQDQVQEKEEEPQCEVPTTGLLPLKGPGRESNDHRETEFFKQGWNKGWAQHSNQ